MKEIKRIISLVLVLTLMSGMIYMPVNAADMGMKTEAGEVTASGTNGFGDLVADAMEADQEVSGEDENYTEGYCISDLTIDGNIATVEYSALEDAVIVVGIYTEDGMELLLSGHADVSAEEQAVEVVLEGNLPEYFMASAYLMDGYDFSPLCAEYDTPMYTQEMQELLASTVEDYDADRVLNLDDDKTTNFAVYEENTKVIPEVAGVNVVATVDEENNIYVIENADDSFKSLKAGDIFAYAYGENEIIIAKVAQIKVSGDTVTITADDVEMDEVFAFVKIEAEGDVGDAVVDTSAADEGVTYLGEVDSPAAHARAYTGEETASKKWAFSVEAIKRGGDGLNVKITGGIELSMKITYSYYVSESYQRIKVDVKAEIGGKCAVTGTIACNILLGEFRYPVVPCVTVEIEVNFVISFEGSVEVFFGYELKGGYIIEHGSQGWDQDGYLKPVKKSIDSEFSGEVFLGFELEAKVKILEGAVTEASVTIEYGLLGKLSQKVEVEFSEDVRHSCIACAEGDVSLKVSLKAGVKFFKSKKLSLSKVFLDYRRKIMDIYWSIDRGEFGFTKCPYVEYRITGYLVDKEGKPISNIAVFAGAESAVTDNDGKFEFWLPVAEYEITATVGEEWARYTLYLDEPREIILKPGEDYDGRCDNSNIQIPGFRVEMGEIVYSGECDDNGECDTWIFDDQGTLHVFSNRGMWAYDMFNEEQEERPWEFFCGEILTVVIYEDVSYIGAEAFYGLPSLSRVIVQEGVKTIESYAFADCNKLVDIALPTSIKTIDCGAFGGCNGLRNVYIPSIADWCKVNFETLDSNPLYYAWHLHEDGRLIENLEVPEGVTGISPYAFCNIDWGNVTIPGTVTGIGYGAFYEASVSSIEVPDGLKTIGDYAFYWVFDLMSIVIPDTVTSIGNYAFSECRNLTEIEFLGNTALGEFAFSECRGLTSISIPYGTTSLYGTFANCDNLEEVTIPDSVVTIGYEAFYGCVSLDSIVIPQSVTYIDGVEYWNGYINCAFEDGMKIIFEGDAPDFHEFSFYERTLTVYYPEENSTWTEDVLQEYGGYNITWAPYTPDDVGTIMSAGGQQRSVDVLPCAIVGGEHGKVESDGQTLRTSSFADLVPGEQYVLLVLVDVNVDDILAADNLLHIDQGVADENGELVFEYVLNEDVSGLYAMACGMSSMDLNDAEITFPEMEANGGTQMVNPVVVYDGVTLIEGVDYEITGDVVFEGAGEYTCYIQGIHDYTGTVVCVYTVTGLDMLLGDINMDGEINIFDANLAAAYFNEVKELTADQLLAGDVNGDGEVNIFDANLIAAYFNEVIDKFPVE